MTIYSSDVTHCLSVQLSPVAFSTGLSQEEEARAVCGERALDEHPSTGECDVRQTDADHRLRARARPL